uniref:LacI family DNA-binding transcriptional regulator n=1 Tax=Alistipes megaguti TaxID=2364787 RepID=UPI000EFB2EC0|nr:LacI family DNA-binding transcriptional regulator [Alistipes megaguti]
MARQKIKIKDIAKMAGVSAGTVDRILHNRGNVSPASREAVEKVLNKVNYKFNLHASAISCRKTFKITVCTPIASPGEYWSSILAGIEHAIEEFSDINISCNYAFYNQYDIYSCKSAYNSLLDQAPQAVIIGPTFIHETQEICGKLDAANIPYLFVDSIIEETRPITTFTTDHYASGFLLGRLLHSLCGGEGSIAIFRALRTGNERASTSLERRRGFMDYMIQAKFNHRIKESTFSVLTPEENEKEVLNFIQNNPDIQGIAIMNSRGYIIADILRNHGIDHIQIISFDLTSNNVRCIENGSITALLCQRPELQGFNAIKAMIQYLLYNRNVTETDHMMPIDIIMKENLPYYQEDRTI